MRKTPLILLADDNPDDQSFIRDAFSYVNANVLLDVVDDGMELLQHLKRSKLLMYFTCKMKFNIWIIDSLSI